MEKKFIPVTLDEAVEHIISKIPQEEIESVKEMTKDKFMSNTHHSLGRFLRNEWGLWFNENEICKYFTSIGINHGDDRSGIILESVYRQVTGKPRDLEEQVNHYKEFWKKSGFKDGIHPLPNVSSSSERSG